MPLVDTIETFQMTNVGDHIDGTDVYQTNPNLLDNPFFTINQRSFTTSSATNNIYCLDRWLIENGGGTQSYANGILTLNNANGANLCNIRQNNAIDIAGKTITLSVMDGNGDIYSISANVPTRTASQQTVINTTLGTGIGARLWLTANSAAYSFIVAIRAEIGTTVTLKAIKLELGSVSTLANDTAPDYGTELRKCQRYFVRLKGTNYLVLNGFAAATNYADFSMPLGLHQFAKAPTITTSGTHTIRNGTTNYTVSSMAAQVNADNIVTGIRMTVSSSTMTAYTLAVYGSDVNSYIDFSADL